MGAGFCISPSPPSLPGQAGRREAQSSCEETKLEKPEGSHGLKPEEKPRKVAVSLVTLGPHVPAGARAPWKLSPRLRSRPSSECGGGRGGPHSPGDRDPGDGDRLCCSRARLAVNGRKGCAVQPRAQLERLSDTGLSPLDAQRIRRGSGRHAVLANFGVRGRGRKAGGGLPGHPRSKPAVWARAPGRTCPGAETAPAPGRRLL